MKTEDRGLRMEDGGIGEVLGFVGVRAVPFQSASRRREDAVARQGGLAQSKTRRRAAAMARRAWRRFGRTGFEPDDNTGFRQFWGVLWRGGQWELKRKWLVSKLQGLGTGRGREIRINPHLTAFVRVFFWRGKKIQNDYCRNPNFESIRCECECVRGRREHRTSNIE